MRVRVALLLAVVGVAAGLALDMSGRAPRIAGTDHVSPVAFVANVPSRGVLCQPDEVLPIHARSLDVLIGTYGHPVPMVRVFFRGQTGDILARGVLPAGTPEGEVAIPLAPAHSKPSTGTLCIELGKTSHAVVFAGEAFPSGPAAEQVNHAPQPGRIGVVYTRGGRESWWQLLPTLTRRFGLGKAALFGDWTLPAAALLLLAVWVWVVRLLVGELR